VLRPAPPASPDVPRTGRLAGPLDAAVTGAAYALVLALAPLLAVWGAFLVPFRLGTTPVPVSLAFAAALLPLTVAGGWLLGRGGAVGPAALWLVTALVLGTRRPEGDIVLTGSPVGTVFLLTGALACAAGVALSPRRRPGPAAAAEAHRPPGGGDAGGAAGG
jgi:hypothetical protein